MRNKPKRPGILLVAAIIYTSLLATSLPGLAATAPREVSVSPSLQEVRINSSEVTKSFDISYTNDSPRTQTLVLSVVDFGSLDQTGGVAFAGSGLSQLFDKYTLSRWLKLPNNKLVLAPGKKATISPFISNGSALAPGGHYAAIVATVAGSGGDSKNKVSLKQKISSLVLAVKTGGEKYDLRLTKIQANGNLLRLPDEVNLTIRGTGNVHVVPRGIVYLKDGNKVLSKGVINQQSSFVLPDSTRVLTVGLNQLAKPALWHHSLTLQVDYRYDGLDTYASKKTNLQYLNPFLLLLALIIVGIITAIGRYKTELKPKRPAIKKKLQKPPK